MNEKELWIAFVALVGFVIYVFMKVRMYMRQSENQWHRVDKTKLRTWDDEDEN